MLRTAERIAVLTGAGVSAESGLATFRGPDGLWEGHRVEDVATPEAFERDPVLVWGFYNTRRASLRSAQPNPGHQALAALENLRGSDRFTLVTQNVDGLHQAAGSRHVLEIHGNLRHVLCSECGKVEDRGTESLPELPRCVECAGLLRPWVVWFHEPLPADVWLKAERAARECSCFLVVGTSAAVYPAAGLIATARRSGAVIVEINIARTAASEEAHLTLSGPSGHVLPRLVQRIS